MEKDSLTIRVSVADRFYPIDIKPEKEELVRKAAKLINDKILELRTKTNSKLETLDYLAMVALQITVSYLDLNEEKDIDLLADEIRSVSGELDRFLKVE